MKYKYKVTSLDDSSIFVLNNKYRKMYPDGVEVEADPNTLGIFCFDDFSIAQIFMSYCDWNEGHKIKKVKTFGKGKVPKKISALTDKISMDIFYQKKLSIFDIIPFTGTICYQKIKVLKTIFSTAHKEL